MLRTPHTRLTSMITESQAKLIQTKYGNLIYKIAQAISGDAALSEYEDNVQDLWMAALEAVDGFQRQHGGANGKFDDFWGNPGFDKYIKTCLWTKKNNKGAKITKKFKVNGKVSALDDFDYKEVEDHKVSIPNIELEEFYNRFTAEEKSIINIISNNPDAIKGSGGVNVLCVSKEAEIPWAFCKTLLLSIGDKISNNL